MHPINQEIQFFLKPESVQTFVEISKDLCEKRFTIADLQVTHRQITYWEKKGLVAPSTEKGQWRKFDFIEYIWIKIILKLREFNIGLSAMHNLRNVLLQVPPNFIEKIVEMPEVIRLFTSLAKEKGLMHDEQKMIEFLQLPHVREGLRNLKPPPPLHYMVVDTMMTRNHYPFLTNAKGEWIFLKESYVDFLSREKFFDDFIHKTYLSLSLTEFVSDFIKEKDISVSHGQLHLLTEKEAEVLRNIRSGNLKSLKIRFNEKDEITLLELTEEKKIDKTSRFVDVIMNHGYQSITVITQNGEPVHCENTRKIKLFD